VVGYSYDAQGKSRAFIWTNGMLFDLNTLVEDAPGWTLTAAYGINESGQIVGSGLFNGRHSAFLLDPVLLEISAASRNLSAVSDVPEPSTVILLAGGLLAFACRQNTRLTTKS
jgi:probable HAF family extracellular repeat protein